MSTKVFYHVLSFLPLESLLIGLQLQMHIDVNRFNKSQRQKRVEQSLNKSITRCSFFNGMSLLLHHIYRTGLFRLFVSIQLERVFIHAALANTKCWIFYAKLDDKCLIWICHVAQNLIKSFFLLKRTLNQNSMLWRSQNFLLCKCNTLM